MTKQPTCRLGDLVKRVSDKVTINKSRIMPYIGLEHIPSSGSRLLGFTSSSESVSANNVFRNGDTLFGKLRPRLRKTVCARFDGYCSTDILVLRPHDPQDADFAAHVLASDAVFQEAIRTEEGTKMPRCSWEDLSGVEVFCPGPFERQRIAEILSTVGDVIEQTEALIAKMQRVKAGLMHDLFTRGVTPDGKFRPIRAEAPHLYKDSPAGWIPMAWKLAKLGNISEIVSGVTLGNRTRIRGGIEIPYLRVANVQDGYLDLRDVKTVYVPEAEAKHLQLHSGDVLMNEGGDFDKLGRGTVWNDEITPCIHQNHVFRVRPMAALRSYYLAYWSQAAPGRRYFLINGKQSTNLASVNCTQLRRMPIALPTDDEQQRIEDILYSMNAQLAALNADAHKLRMTKNGLMHDLLTGRVRVPVAEPVGV